MTGPFMSPIAMLLPAMSWTSRIVVSS
jgi:hypothetical protein